MEYCPHVDGMNERCCNECTLKRINREMSPFETFVNNKWNYLEDTDIKYSYEKYTKMLENKNKKNYLWLTLSPDKKLRNMVPNVENTKKLADWANCWFEYALGRWYNGYTYVLEGAINNDHLHLHCVVDLKSSHNHAEVQKRS
jgi:hypothetical protein